MKRIETKRPSVLGTPSRRFNSDQSVANFTPLIDSEIMSKAEIRGAKDGFPYLRDIILVLFALYGNGTVSPRLGRALPGMIDAWVKREPPQTQRRVIVKRNFKLRRDTYEKALKRWRIEAPEEAHTATAMFAFLLESYGDGELEFALRQGNGEGNTDFADSKAARKATNKKTTNRSSKGGA